MLDGPAIYMLASLRAFNGLRGMLQQLQGVVLNEQKLHPFDVTTQHPRRPGVVSEAVGPAGGSFLGAILEPSRTPRLSPQRCVAPPPFATPTVPPA